MTSEINIIYYHVTQKSEIRFKPPGYYGAYLGRRAKDSSKSPFVNSAEELLEKVRVKNHPNKPSRYRCNFLWDQYKQAVEFKKINHPEYEIYEAEILDRNKPTHRGDMDWRNYICIALKEKISIEQGIMLKNIGLEKWRPTH